MYLLDNLWRGNISPSERFVRRNSEYSKISEKFCDEMEAFMATLSPEAKRQMESVEDLRISLSVIHDEDLFIYAFRMGAQMILDVVGTYKSPFYDITEAGQ